MRPELRDVDVDTPEGQRLRVHLASAPPAGPTLLLVPPPSTTVSAFTRQLEYLGAHAGFVAWDARGLHTSGRAVRDDYSLAAHVRDAEAALATASASAEISIVGWGIGCQVALAIAGGRPSRVRHLVLLDGVYGPRFAAKLGIERRQVIVPSALRLARGAYPALARVRKRASGWPETPAWLKRFGLASATLDDELFAEMATPFRGIDVDAYARTMIALLDDAGAPDLTSLRMPVLVVEGSEDRWGSALAARRLVRKLPFGELFVVRGGTHYTPLEFPELVNLRIEKFLGLAA